MTGGPQREGGRRGDLLGPKTGRDLHSGNAPPRDPEVVTSPSPLQMGRNDLLLRYPPYPYLVVQGLESRGS